MRKNILIFGHSYAPQFVDIYNQYTRLFDPNEYDVTIAFLTGKPNDEIKKRTVASDVLFLDIPKKQIRGLKLSAIRTMLALCRKKRFHLVVCHRYKPSYIMLWVSQLCRIPNLICVMHELNTMTSVGRRLLIAMLARKNVFFGGVSNAVRDDLRRSLWRIPENRIITLYNSIDVPLIEPQLLSRDEARAALHVNADEVVFGHVARLVPNKDQASLIRAFNQIKPTCPNAKLILIGSGVLEDTLKKQAESSPYRDDIVFTGYLDQGFRYMKAFDCFVLSSVQEAFGRVLLEAMIASVPVIATRANGIPEVMGNTGKLIEPQNVDAMATAMKSIYDLTPDERSNLARNGYEHMLAHFSIPAFQQQFWQLAFAKE